MISSRELKRCVASLTLSFFLPATVCPAGQITIDGNTRTSLDTRGNVTDVTTKTVLGQNAFNSFEKFDVDPGNVVNLYLPGAASNLLNLVHSERTDINGILNSIKDGQIGGNVFFANPNGIVIGRGGVVNVGSLVAVTPTKSFMEGFFESPGNPSAEAAGRLLNGEAPINPEGIISISGKINAAADVVLAAGSARNLGKIASGAVFAGGAADFSDIVNLNGLEAGTRICVENGDIEIRAEKNFLNYGVINADGADGLGAGNISVRAGEDVYLGGNSRISARGRGENSSGGSVTVLAGDSAVLAGDSIIDVRGGDFSGDGGFAEFSGDRNVTLDGGSILAGAEYGIPGSVLIDPDETLNINADWYTWGAHHVFEATGTINVGGVIVSSRDIAPGGDQETADSIGPSGDLTFTAPTINVLDDARILAHATGPYEGGNIHLDAESGYDLAWISLIPNFNDLHAGASVNIGAALLKGENVEITASALTKKTADIQPEDFTDSLLLDVNESGVFDFAGIAEAVVSKAESSILIGSGARIEADNDVTIKAEANSEVSLKTPNKYVGISYGDSEASADVSVEGGAGGAVIAAGNNVDIKAKTDNTLSLEVKLVEDVPSGISFAYGKGVSDSGVQIGSGATVTAGNNPGSIGNVNVTAENLNKFSVKTESKGFEAGSAAGGVGVSISDVTSTATVGVNGSVTAPGDVQIDARTTNEKNEISASAEVKQKKPDDSSALNKLNGFLGGKTEKTNQQSEPNTLGVGAAVAVANSSNTADSSIGTGAEIAAGGNLTVSSRAEDNFKSSATGTAGDAEVAIGGAVAVTDYLNQATARIEGATVDAGKALTVEADAVIPHQVEIWDDLKTLWSIFSSLPIDTGSVPDFFESLWDYVTGSAVDDFGTIIETLQPYLNENLGIPDKIATSYVQAGGETSKDGTLSISGSVNILTVDNQAEAYIGPAARINTKPAYQTAEQKVKLDAYGSIETIDIVGELSVKSFGYGTGGGTVGLGGSYNGVAYNNSAKTHIDDGAEVNAMDDVDLVSKTDNFILTITKAGDNSKKFGIAGAFSWADLANDTQAYIEDQARVATGDNGDLTLNADNDITSINITGAVGRAGNVGVGASVSLNEIDNVTHAFIGNVVDSALPGDGRIDAGNTIGLSAASDENIYSISVAGVFPESGGGGGGGGGGGSGGTTGFEAQVLEENGGGEGDFGIGLSGDVSFNFVQDDTQAYISDAADVDAGGLLSLNAENDPFLLAIAGSVAVSDHLGIGGSYSHNDLDLITKAWTARAGITSGGADLKAIADDKMITIAAGGAGSKKGLSVAGSANFNRVINDTGAGLGDGTVLTSTGDVTVEARAAHDIISVAGAVSGSKKAGVGAAIDLGFVNNTVRAYAGKGTEISADTGNVSLKASSDEDIISVAACLAIGGEGGLGGAASTQNLTDDVQSFIDENASVSTGKNVLIDAGNDAGLVVVSGAAGGGKKAGLGLSVANVNVDRTVKAYVGKNAQVTALGSEPMAFTSTENFQGLMVNAGSRDDFYTIAAGGGLAGDIAVTGAAAVVTLNSNLTGAYIEENALINGDNTGAADGQSVQVRAAHVTDILGVGGAISGSKTAGLGGAVDTKVINKTVDAHISGKAKVNAEEDVLIRAYSEDDLFSVAAGAAFSKLSLEGSASVLVLTNNTKAYIGDDDAQDPQGAISAGGDVSVEAESETGIDSIAGSAAVGLTAGIGVSNSTVVRNDTVEARIGKNADVTGLEGISVTADSHEDIMAITVGAAAGKVAISGCAAVKVLTDTTRAYIDEGARVNAVNDQAAADQDVLVRASDSTELFTVAGAIGGGLAGIGGAADVGVILKDTDAYIITSAGVNAARDVIVRAESNEDVNSIAACAEAGKVGVAGSASVYDVTNTTRAYIGESADVDTDGTIAAAVVEADGNVVVSAEDDTEIDIISGSAGLGILAGVGAAAGVTVIVKNTQAFVGDGSTVTAKGTKGPTLAHSGEFNVDYVAPSTDEGEANFTLRGNEADGVSGKTDSMSLLSQRQAAKAEVPVSGLAVTAINTDDIETIAACVGGGLKGGLAASGEVNVTVNRTEAYIASGARINPDDPGASILVAAGSDYYHMGIAPALAGGLFVGASPSASVSVISNNVSAHIDRLAEVGAAGDITVRANAEEEILSVAAGLGGGIVGLAPSAAVVVIDNDVSAYLDENAVAGAGGNLSVLAKDETEIDTVSATLAIGGIGIAGSAGVNVVSKNVDAHIGNYAETNAGGTTEVKAVSRDDIDVVVVSGAGGSVAGVAGAAAVNVVETNTKAYIGNGARVNQDDTYDTDLQTVKVVADSETDIKDVAVGASLGFFGGLGAGVDVGIIRNNTTAYVGGGAEVDAEKDIEVTALSKEKADSTSVAGAAGVGVAIAGAVSVVSIGTGLDSDSREGLESQGGGDDFQTHMDTRMSNGEMGNTVGAIANQEEANNATNKVRTTTAGLSVGSTIDEATVPEKGTTAMVGKGAQLNAGGNIDINAQDTVDVDITTGSGAFMGIVSAGGAVGITSVKSNVNSYVDSDDLARTILNAGGNINVSSNLLENSAGDAFAGAGYGLVGLGAAVIYLNTEYDVDSHIDDYAVIEEADEVAVEADSSTDDSADGFGGAAAGVAIGVSYGKIGSTGTTRAYLGDNVDIGQTAGKTVGDVRVDAAASSRADSYAKAGAAGILAGNGAVAKTSVNPTVTAYVGRNAEIDVENDVSVRARGVVESLAKTGGGSFGGVAVGVGISEAKSAALINSYIDENADISAGGNVAIEALGNYDENGNLLDKLVRAQTWSASGSLLVSVDVPEAKASSSFVVGVGLGDNAEVETGGDLNVIAKANSAQTTSNCDGHAYSIAAIGNNVSSSSVTNNVTAYIGQNAGISSENVNVDAYGKSYANASTESGSGGLYGGAAAKASTSTTNIVNAGIVGNENGEVNKTISAANDVSVSARTASTFSADSDSLAAGLAGRSGTRTNNYELSTADARIGKNADIEAGRDINVTAANVTTKPYVGTNLDCGAGGFYGESAGRGATTILNGAIALVEGNDETGQDEQLTTGRDVNIQATNDVYAYEKGALSTGGFIALANVNISISNSNTAGASIGDNADIDSANDVNVTSRTSANVEGVAHTSTWGFAASGDSTSNVTVTADNDTVIGQNVKIRAEQNLNLFAGKDIQGHQNNLRSKAEARSWVSGGWPMSDNTAWAHLYDLNNVYVASGADLRAGRDANLGGYLGLRAVQGYALAKKKSYLLFGIPITIYSNGSRRSNFISNDVVTVDGLVEGGASASKTLYIDFNENVVGEPTIGYQKIGINLKAELQVKIDDLNAEIEALEAGGGDTDLIDALKAQKLRLSEKMAEYDALPPEDLDVTLFVLDDVKTGTGNVNVTGTLAGTGTLKAPGEDIKIEVINGSQANLEAHRMEIPVETGGDITLNGRKITTHPTVNIEYGPEPGRRIIISNTFDPDNPDVPEDARPSDIVLKDDIINTAGWVLISNSSGSVANFADIIADEIQILVPNGDFVHDYTPGLYETPNVIAGNNVYISAEILNIKSLIQSGIAYRTIVIPEFTDEDLYDDPLTGVYNIVPTVGDSNIKAVWDADKQVIRLYRVNFSGGKIELFGEIVSTGGGQLKVMDGYGEVDIVNNSSRDLQVNKIDIGERINGIIKITDTGKRLDTPIGDKPLVTMITGSNGDLKVAEGYDRWNEDDTVEFIQLNENLVTGRSTEYTPYEGAYFVKTETETRTVAMSNRLGLPDWMFNIWWVRYFLNPWIVYRTETLVKKYKVAAESPIGVELIGNPAAGNINITGTTAADILINNNITNESGDITISNQGNILAANNNSILFAQNIHLNAAEGGIGSLDQQVNINTQDGYLEAAAGGLVNIEEVQGDLTIRSIAAGGDVRIVADGSILDGAPGTDAAISGKGMNLSAIGGGIGLAADALHVDSDGALSADADQGVYLTETAGAMRVNRIVSINGDVILTSDGAIEDYNFTESRDEDVAAELAGIWDDLELTNKDGAIARYQAQKKEEYTAQYLLNDGGTPGDASDDVYAEGYDPNWEYTLTPEELASFQDGVWSVEELVNAKDVYTVPAAGNNGLPTKPDVLTEESNISGQNVILRANAGVGQNLAEEVISEADIEAGNVTYEQKIMIANAEKDDVSYEDGYLTVNQRNDFDVQATGVIDIQAENFVYLGSEEDVNIKRVDSIDNSIRLKIGGKISNVADPGEANLIADDVTIDADDDIGTPEIPITTDLRAGGGLIARSKGNIYLYETAGDLSVDQVLSSKNVVLGARGSLLDHNADSYLNVQAGDIHLYTLLGGIGTADNDFNFESVNGIFSTDAEGNVYVTSAQNEVNAGGIKSRAGNVTLTSTLPVLDGTEDGAANVEGEDLVLTVLQGTAGTDEDALDVIQTGTVTATVSGNINLNATSGSSLNVNRIRSIVGVTNLTADDSILNARTDAEINLLGGDMNLHAVGGSIGAAEKYLVADSTGTIDMLAGQNIYLEERAGNFVTGSSVAQNGSIGLLVSGGNADIDQIAAFGDIKLDVYGGSISVNRVDASTLDFFVADEGGNLLVTDAYVSHGLTINADNVDLANVTHTVSDVPLHFDVSGNDGWISDNVNISADSGASIVFDNLVAEFAYLNVSTGLLDIVNGIVGTYAEIYNDLYRVTIDYKFDERGPSTSKRSTKYRPFYLTLTGDGKMSTNAHPTIFANKEVYP